LAIKKSAANAALPGDASPIESTAELPDFEATLAEIETIVRKLESGELSLDNSLRQYEVAVGKMRVCYRLLEVAERRVSVLAGFDADGNPVTEPLEDAGDGQGNDAETLLEKQKNRGGRRGVRSRDDAGTDAVGLDD
jgi:exodeoxyribonuclease VII small subunit